jgi:hypothetical protein
MAKETSTTAGGTDIVEKTKVNATWFVIRHKPSGTYVLDPLSGTDAGFGNDADEIFLTKEISKAAFVEQDSSDVHNLVTSLAFTYTDDTFIPTQEFELVRVELVVEPEYALTVEQRDWFTEGLESAEDGLKSAASMKVAN